MKFQAEMRGANFRSKEDKEVLKSLSVGDEFTLIRDEENEYDTNAIACYYEDEGGELWHVGFIAKEIAEEIAPLMDEGLEFRCYIHSWLSTLKPYVIIEQI